MDCRGSSGIAMTLEVLVDELICDIPMRDRRFRRRVVSRGLAITSVDLAVPVSCRARPTIRCLVDDLGIELPSLDVDLGEIDHPLLEEVRRLAPASPRGQKRILAIDQPLIYRVRVSDYRGGTWVDEEHSIVWLCATRRREEGSEADAYRYFQYLHEQGNLLPTDDDYLRDRAEAAIRLQRGLTTALLALVDQALANPGNEYQHDLGNWLPCRVLVLESGGVQEIWCSLGTRAIDGTGVKSQLRDLLFAAVEQHVSPALFEVRSDWPTGSVDWAEVVMLGLR
jgi:hypothetical protein